MAVNFDPDISQSNEIIEDEESPALSSLLKPASPADSRLIHMTPPKKPSQPSFIELEVAEILQENSDQEDPSLCITEEIPLAK